MKLPFCHPNKLDDPRNHKTTPTLAARAVPSGVRGSGSLEEELWRLQRLAKDRIEEFQAKRRSAGIDAPNASDPRLPTRRKKHNVVVVRVFFF